MSITTTSQFKAFLGLAAEPEGAAEALETAEVLVAAYIGTATLAQATQAEVIIPVRNRSTIEVSLAPITTLTSVTYDSGSETVADTSVDATSPWAVKQSDGDLFSTIQYTVNYTSGWVSGDIPEEAKRAILATAEALIEGGGRGTTSESVGDYARMVGSGESSSAIPPIARELLRKWRRPQI